MMRSINNITRVAGSTAGTQVQVISVGPSILESIHVAQTLNGIVTVMDIADGTAGTAVAIIGTSGLVGTHYFDNVHSKGISIAFGTNSAANEVSVIWRK